MECGAGRLFCAHTWREVCRLCFRAPAAIGMSWKAGVAAELIGMATGTVGERIYQAKLLIETADLLAWTVLVVAASWACERVLVWLLRVSGPVAWHVAVRAHGDGLRGRAGGPAGDGAAAELAFAGAIARPGLRRSTDWCFVCPPVGAPA